MEVRVEDIKNHAKLSQNYFLIKSKKSIPHPFLISKKVQNRYALMHRILIVEKFVFSLIVCSKFVPQIGFNILNVDFCF